MLDRRTLLFGLAAVLFLPAADAALARNDKGGKSKGGGGDRGNGNSTKKSGGQGGGNRNGNNGNGRGGSAKGGSNGNGKGGGNPGKGQGKGGNGNNGNGNANGNVNGNSNSNDADSGNASPHQPLEAVRSGKALPLRQIQQMIGPRYPGVLIEAQLQNRGTGLFYDLKMLSPQGRVFVLTVNAATGAVTGR